MILTQKTNKPSSQLLYINSDFDISDISVQSLSPLSKNYCSDNRIRLKQTLKKTHKQFKADSIAIFKGQISHKSVLDSDTTAEWRPDWNFFYLFGLKNETAESYTVLDFQNMLVTLFIDEKSEEQLIFEGGVNLDDNPSDLGFN
jgi:Aminopeptidase P, N-terminal domain